jgi:hypothetical protein
MNSFSSKTTQDVNKSKIKTNIFSFHLGINPELNLKKQTELKYC